MKKVKMVSVLLVVSMFLAACSTFTVNTYRSIYLAGSTYNLTMNSISAIQAQGKITADQRTKINQYAQIYYNSYQVAVKAFETYNANKDATSQDLLVNALTAAVNNWGLLANLVNSIVPGTVTPVTELSNILRAMK